ncbi:alpha/beta hydrolase family protein [Haloplasma contractile]|uniref:alpha/beta hydrolase family protein n=1 Tax=Haloplasma contractile TaxID=471825 RepID=UPI001376F07C|nr:dienelactone hydrolase family protein [Haloplasma contractile]
MITVLLLMTLSILLATIFPVFQIPAPSGEHTVGTRTFELIDEDREEIYSNHVSAKKRKIKYQVWYPATNIEDDSVSSWLQEGKPVSVGVSRLMGFPDFVLTHTALINSNSYLDAKLKTQTELYPVVIISHGWTGFRNLHTNMAEMLASHGYIVVSIDHTYGAAVTVFENGTTAYLNPDALPDRDTTENFLEYANTLVNTYALDIQFVIDQLEIHNQDNTSFLYNQLDLTKIGLLGHSTGGGAATKTVITDSRVSAVVGLDPWVEPIQDTIIKDGIQVPGLFLRSEEWEVHENNEQFKQLNDASEYYASTYQINETLHTDFTMAPMYSPLTKTLGMAGELDYNQSFEIQSDFLLNFYNLNLKGEESKTSQELKEAYSEVVDLTFE